MRNYRPLPVPLPILLGGGGGSLPPIDLIAGEATAAWQTLLENGSLDQDLLGLLQPTHEGLRNWSQLSLDGLTTRFDYYRPDFTITDEDFDSNVKSGYDWEGEGTSNPDTEDAAIYFNTEHLTFRIKEANPPGTITRSTFTPNTASPSGTLIGAYVDDNNASGHSDVREREIYYRTSDQQWRVHAPSGPWQDISASDVFSGTWIDNDDADSESEVLEWIEANNPSESTTYGYYDATDNEFYNVAYTAPATSGSITRSTFTPRTGPSGGEHLGAFANDAGARGDSDYDPNVRQLYYNTTNSIWRIHNAGGPWANSADSNAFTGVWIDNNQADTEEEVLEWIEDNNPSASTAYAYYDTADDTFYDVSYTAGTPPPPWEDATIDEVTDDSNPLWIQETTDDGLSDYFSDQGYQNTNSYFYFNETEVRKITNVETVLVVEHEDFDSYIKHNYIWYHELDDDPLTTVAAIYWNTTDDTFRIKPNGSAVGYTSQQAFTPDIPSGQIWLGAFASTVAAAADSNFDSSRINWAFITQSDGFGLSAYTFVTWNPDTSSWIFEMPANIHSGTWIPPNDADIQSEVLAWIEMQATQNTEARHYAYYNSNDNVIYHITYHPATVSWADATIDEVTDADNPVFLTQETVADLETYFEANPYNTDSNYFFFDSSDSTIKRVTAALPDSTWIEIVSGTNYDEVTLDELQVVLATTIRDGMMEIRLHGDSITEDKHRVFRCVVTLSQGSVEFLCYLPLDLENTADHAQTPQSSGSFLLFMDQNGILFTDQNGIAFGVG